VLRYKDPKEKIGWIKTLKKQLKTIIDNGTLSDRGGGPTDVAILTIEANKIKLNQEGNVDISLKFEFV
jgi:hypothetical protein